MLEHDEVALTGGVLHFSLEGSAQRIERVTAGSDLLVGEEADPAQAGEDAISVVVVGEGGLGRDSGLEILLGVGSRAEDLLRGVLPGHRRLEIVCGLVAEEAHVDQRLDHLREALVAQGAADQVLGFGDFVALAERGRVAVRVRDEGKAGVDEVWFGRGHEVGAGDAEFLAVFVELGRVAESEEHASARPRELVP